MFKKKGEGGPYISQPRVSGKEDCAWRKPQAAHVKRWWAVRYISDLEGK